MKIGVALSGGGARGYVHLGILQALDDFNITPTYMSGTSSGANLGILYASGYNPREILDLAVKTSFLMSMRPTLKKGGLLSTRNWDNKFRKMLRGETFESLRIPFFVCASDIEQGRSVYFHTGQILPAVKASACIPGVFPPVEINGRRYIDGGILDNLPISPLKDVCDLIIGCSSNPVSDSFDGQGAFSVVMRSLLLTVNQNLRLSAKSCDYFIEPPAGSEFSPANFNKSKELFEIGLEFTTSFLAEIKREHPWDPLFS